MATTTRTCCDDKNANANVNANVNDNVNVNHDDYRIALYYAYIELTPSEIQSHIDIQKQICDDLNLKGRIRISKEGVNGVLSGELTLLQKYEELISNNIQQIIVVNNSNNDNKISDNISKKKRFISSAVNDDDLQDDDYDDSNININTEDTNIDSDDILHTPTTATPTPANIALDVKYCQLRKELPIQDQLFDRLLIKETKTVISLFDQSFEKKKESKKDRYRRRREYKHEEQQQMLLLRRKQNTNNTNTIDNDNDNSTDHNYQQQKQQKQQQQQCVDRDDDDGIGSDNNNNNNNNNDNNYNDKKNTTTPIINKKEDENSIDIKSSSPYLDLQSLHNAVMEESLNPTRHLSANEWNQKLDEAGLSSSSDSSSSTALLLDVRNVYEMRVGHFVHPTTPTLLTNTRKYSDLPQLIASNKEIKEREQIFMYCTGGVRCERVSMLVRELYPDKQIYQLRGGIQKYIQTCSEQQEEEQQQQQQQQEDSIDSKVENENNTTTTTNSYFAGKNFVFDPRRTDPIHFGETIGRCLVCDLPHDDYDNGHAPSENKEARCNKCRMLILICNDCRPKYRCHNEKEKEKEDEDEDEDEEESNINNIIASEDLVVRHDDDNSLKCESRSNTTSSCRRPLLYCNLDHCSHEGTFPDPELFQMTIKQQNKL